MINLLVNLKHYILGNNGFLIPATVYIYIGGTAERLVSLLKSNDSEMQKYEMYFIMIGGVILTLLICFVSYVTKKKLNEALHVEESQDDEIEMINKDKFEKETKTLEFWLVN